MFSFFLTFFPALFGSLDGEVILSTIYVGSPCIEKEINVISRENILCESCKCCPVHTHTHTHSAFEKTIKFQSHLFPF